MSVLFCKTVALVWLCEEELKLGVEREKNITTPLFLRVFNLIDMC